MASNYSVSTIYTVCCKAIQGGKRWRPSCTVWVRGRMNSGLQPVERWQPRLPAAIWRTFISNLRIVLIALPLAGAFAAVHPVPLDKNTDAAKCLECHSEKNQGKAIHSAMTTGCMSCHEIRINKDVTRVKLITATPAALCLTCHADKNAADLKGTVHSPAVRNCVKCHDPHSSDNKNQLVKASAGGEKENLC